MDLKTEQKEVSNLRNSKGNGKSEEHLTVAQHKGV